MKVSQIWDVDPDWADRWAWRLSNEEQSSDGKINIVSGLFEQGFFLKILSTLSPPFRLLLLFAHGFSSSKIFVDTSPRFKTVAWKKNVSSAVQTLYAQYPQFNYEGNFFVPVNLLSIVCG